MYCTYVQTGFPLHFPSLLKERPSMKSKSGIPCVSEVRHFAIDYYLSDSTFLTHFQHHSVCGTVENFSQHRSHYVRSLWMAPAELCSWSPSQPRGFSGPFTSSSHLRGLSGPFTSSTNTEHPLCAELWDRLWGHEG